MVEISEGVYVDEDEIEEKFEDIIVMKDGVLIYVEAQIKDVSRMS